MRPEKEAILQEVSERLQGASSAFLLNYGGMTAGEMKDLRQSLQAHEARALVAKNKMVGKVATALGWEDLSAMLTGPTAVITGSGDASELAKLLTAFVRNNKKAVLKGACLDGKALTSADVDALSTLPSREVMLALMVGTVAAPMTQLVGVFSQKLRSLLYVLQAAAEKKEQAA